MRNRGCFHGQFPILLPDKKPAPLRNIYSHSCCTNQGFRCKNDKKHNQTTKTLEKKENTCPLTWISLLKDPFVGNGSELILQCGGTCRKVIHFRVGGIRLSSLLSLSFCFFLKGAFKIIIFSFKGKKHGDNCFSHGSHSRRKTNRSFHMVNLTF